MAYLVSRKVGQDDRICGEVSSLWIFEFGEKAVIGFFEDDGAA